MEELDLELVHDIYSETVPQRPPNEDPEVVAAWRHGLVGTEAVSRYVQLVLDINDENNYFI